MPRVTYPMFHRPPPNGVSHGSHYERLSRDVLRLDQTFRLRLQHRRGFPWRWVLVMGFVVAMFWIGVAAVAWTIWRLIHP